MVAYAGLLLFAKHKIILFDIGVDGCRCIFVFFLILVAAQFHIFIWIKGYNYITSSTIDSNPKVTLTYPTEVATLFTNHNISMDRITILLCNKEDNIDILPALSTLSGPLHWQDSISNFISKISAGLPLTVFS